MYEMLFFHLAGDEDDIEVDKTTSRTAGNFIHKTLEGLSSVPKTKGHPGELKKTKRCCDSCLWDVLSKGYLVVGPYQVSDEEYTAAFQIL